MHTHTQEIIMEWAHVFFRAQGIVCELNPAPCLKVGQIVRNSTIRSSEQNVDSKIAQITIPLSSA